MGLFTKKTYTCRQCGKEYEARINLSGGLCKECSDKREQDRKEISGYLEYGLKTNRDYKEDVWKDIAMHRDGILEKYRDKGSITKEELMAAGENYKKLSEDEATDVYTRALRSCFTLTMGAASTFTFFCPTQYEGVVVDAEDVFAIGYCTSSIRLHRNYHNHIHLIPDVQSNQLDFEILPHSHTKPLSLSQFHNVQ